MAGTERTIRLLNDDMDFNVDDLWEKVKLTHHTALEEWTECFKRDENEDESEDNENAAKREIRETLMKSETWKIRSRNFLLRLISDDENGYSNQKDSGDGNQPRPRVHLAMAFVEQMAEYESAFVEYLRETLSVQASEARSTTSVENIEDENAQESVGLTNGQQTDGHSETSLRKRGNGLIHEAAKNGRCAILKQLKLLTAENVDYVNNVGETALHLAAEFEHIKDVEILLGAGAQLKVCELRVML